MQNPANTLLEVSMMYAVPRCLHAIAEIGVADVLDQNARTAEELAASCGASGDALARLCGWFHRTGFSNRVRMVGATRRPRVCYARITRTSCAPLFGCWV